MKVSKILPIVALMSALIITACHKHDDEQENLNTVRLKVGILNFAWSDTDGAGGNAPKVDTIRITPNLTATDFTVLVQDGSTNPLTDYTDEIIAESDAHLFVFTPTGANVTVSGLSNDKNGKAFGQSGKIATGAVSTGTLKIVLKHEPDKAAANPGNTGTTDIEAVFPVLIR